MIWVDSSLQIEVTYFEETKGGISVFRSSNGSSAKKDKITPFLNITLISLGFSVKIHQIKRMGQNIANSELLIGVDFLLNNYWAKR